jgi:proline iminopeptidase
MGKALDVRPTFVTQSVKEVQSPDAAIVGARVSTSIPTSEGFIPAEPGIHLYYRIVGDGANAVIILNANWWAELCFELADNRTLIFYDPRSRGRSSTVTSSRHLGLEHDVRDLEAVRRYFDLRRFTVLGHSINAAIAALYASENPQRVERLLLTCPIPPWRPREWDQESPGSEALLYPPGIPRLDELRREGVDQRDRAAFCHAWLTEFLLPAQMANPQAMARLPLDDICSFANEWPENLMPLLFDQLLRRLGDWDFRPCLADVELPVLVFHASQDLIPDRASRDWAAACPDARIVVLPGSGHYPFVECPDAFFPAVRDFLDGVWPAGAEPVTARVEETPPQSAG